MPNRSRSRLYQTEGIVLSRRDHGEADRVIVMLTPDGRVDLLAKGIRKLRSRKAGHLELFARTKVLASRVTGSWDIISQAESEDVRRKLREDFTLGTYARYVAELAVRLFESDTGGELYSLLDETLQALEEAKNPALLVRHYEQQVLALAGFRPEWHRCVGERGHDLCRRELHPRPEDRRYYGIDPERGGALCQECASRPPQGQGFVRRLSPSALSWLQALQRRDYAEIMTFAYPAQTAAELERTMEYYIAYHLERRPASLRIMRGRRMTNDK